MTVDTSWYSKMKVIVNSTFFCDDHLTDPHRYSRTLNQEQSGRSAADDQEPATSFRVAFL